MKTLNWTLILALLGACGDADEAVAPPAPITAAPTAIEQTATLFAPAADLLVVVDNSGSMCQEQASAAQALGLFAERAVEAGIDLRIAVVTTDMREQPGVFVTEATAPAASLNCRTPEGDPLIPDTADCPATLAPIIGPTADVEALKRDIRCAVTQGTHGDGFEAGLEAMRLGLSCHGPNAAAFAACCTPDGFDPTCTAPVDFLRPQAQLLVMVISDEDDCSAPELNPEASRLPICRDGTAGDGVPDGYRTDPACAEVGAEACYLGDCPGFGDCETDTCEGLCIEGRCAQTPEMCRINRCVVSRRDNSNCAWFRGTLVPIKDYRDFLMQVKPRGLEQVGMVALVGEEFVTPSGQPVRFNPGRPPEGCEEGDFSEACCPAGQCRSDIHPVCESRHGAAFAGARYRALAEAVGGCDPLNPNSPTCPTICQDDFSAPAETLAALMEGYGQSACLDAMPQCEVADPERRPCTALEALDPRNLQVDFECEGCGPEAVRIVFDTRCQSGALAVFDPDLPRDTTVTLRYRGVVRNP